MSSVPLTVFASYDFSSYSSVIRVGLVVGFLVLVRHLGYRSQLARREANIQIAAARKRQRRDERRDELWNAWKDKLEQRAQKAQAKQALTDENGDDLSDFLLPTPAEQTRILSLSVAELRQELDNGKLTSVQLVILLTLRSIAMDRLLSCVTEDVYEQALVEARKADAKRTARKKGLDKSTPGLLEGIPLSLKEQIDLKGTDSTCGFAVRTNRPLREDGLLVSLLKKQGAIPFVKTNVPQGLMVPESDNVIYGVAKNPWNELRTPGGSTGGEAALIAARASFIGVGTDIGGSLRIPAAFCGITSYKPTPQRMSLAGLGVPCENNASGQNAIRPSAGPMANRVEDLVLLMKSWLVPEMWESDPSVPPLPFNSAVYEDRSKKLRIGYYEHDGWFNSAPGNARAVRQAVHALRERGHTLVPFQPPHVEEAVKLYYAILTADGVQTMLDGLEGESLNPRYKALFYMMKIPRFFKKIICKILPLIGEHRSAKMLPNLGERSAWELWNIHIAQQKYCDEFLQAWRDAELDLVIAPGMSLPALTHGSSKDLTPACATTFLYNLLHYPAGSVPVSTVDKNETKYEDEYNDSLTKFAAAVCKDSEGLPLNVQVVGLPYQDELVLRGMLEVQEAVKFKTWPKITEQVKI